MAEKDYYEILGVSRNATPEEIKAAYKQLARKHHPDLAGLNADQEKFKEISNAYSVLSDPQKRQQYDHFGQAGASGQAGANDQGFSGFSTRGFGAHGFGTQDFNFSDIFSSFMDDEDNIFSRFSGGRRKRQSSQENLDIVHNLDLDFETAVKGGKKKIEIYVDDFCSECDGTGSKSKNPKTCSTCKGQGRVLNSKRTPFGMFSVESICPTCKGKGTIIDDPCSSCSAKGYVKVKKILTVDIPAGINTQDVIKLREKGHNHSNEKGDLFLRISVKEHEFYKREDRDLFCELPLPYSDFVLGTTFKLNFFGDKLKVKVPSSTKPNTIFKLKGKGLPDVNRGGNYGSLFVKVVVEVPSKLSSDYKKLIKNLSALEEKETKKDILKRYSKYLID
ncbi:MAG: molecular chaperone DnaJ [archaeon]|jgi:molecular chaperone DnaJ|nr:molecular chaperone DnaJ [archaeon]MDD2477999.1 molecular chaperone DnaJ [Candidatus ainarchaeum sp.]MDD3084873.1 molecular chaperone DnaJ [Candidatus ainarchaeum sp.]MDD4662974.1 molecular chaperone DnaJ [Candidatus ainarchaeum sp.]